MEVNLLAGHAVKSALVETSKLDMIFINRSAVVGVNRRSMARITLVQFARTPFISVIHAMSHEIVFVNTKSAQGIAMETMTFYSGDIL